MKPRNLFVLFGGPASVDTLLIEAALRRCELQVKTVHVPGLEETFTCCETACFDLFFVDAHLANGGLCELLTRVRRGAPDMPLVVVTGVSDHEAGATVLLDGADEYLLREKIDEKRLERCICLSIRRKTLAEAFRESEQLRREECEKLAHAMETLKVMHEIDLSILSSLEPRQILETAIRNIDRVIPCDRAEAILLDREGQAFSRITNEGDSNPQAFVPLSEPDPGSEIPADRPQYIPDIDPEISGDDNRCLVRVPLAAKGTAIGILSVASRRPAAFSRENLAALEQLAGLIGVAFENARLVADLQELFLGIVKCLSSAIDAKSSWTAGHSGRVTGYALLLGHEIRLSAQELRDLELAGLLHDVGKLGTYDAILDKNGILTDEEYEIIKRHPVRGGELLTPIRQLKNIIPAVKHHHERFDGKGYPQGLKGSSIPDLARILAVADAFDSMTGWRPYHKTFSRDEAVLELRRCSGSQFDPVLAQHFIQALERTGFEGGADGRPPS